VRLNFDVIVQADRQTFEIEILALTLGKIFKDIAPAVIRELERHALAGPGLFFLQIEA
jgi:hypothetical protein